MSTNILKVAIVGCGKMASHHLDKVLRKTPPSSIALCDREIIKAQLLGEMYGISNVYDSLDRVIEEFYPDVYHIVTPPSSHKALAVKCMRAGGHVYIEKPVCLTVRDFDELQETAFRCNRLVCAGHQRLFEREFRQVQALVEKKALGRIIHVHGHDSGPYLEMEDEGLSKGWWKDFTGGMFLDLLPHIMSVFTELVDDLSWEHSFIRTDSQSRPAEMHGYLSSASSPVTCSFCISFGTKFIENYYRIECEKGIILLNFRNKFWYVVKKSKLPELVGRLTVNYSAAAGIALANSRSILSLLAGRYDPHEGTGALIERFYEAVAEQGESPTTIPAMRKVVELCEQAVRACFPAPDCGRTPAAEVANRQLDTAAVLVTGAGGFIGKHLVRRLLDEGRTVRAMVRRPVREDHFGPRGRHSLEICVGDLTDHQFAAEACRGVRSVYHLAASTKGDLFFQMEGTCIGAKNLLKAVKENNVHKLVYISSVSVLDQTNFPGHGVVGDNFPLEAYPLKRGAYTYSKLKAEEMVRAFAAEHNLEVAILRPGIVWGPGSEQLLLETHFKLGSRVLIVLGRARKRLPLIYVENLVDALIKAGDAQLSDAQPMNIVDFDNPSQRRYLRLLGRMAGKRYFGLFIPLLIVTPAFWAAERVLGFMLRKPVHVCYQIKSKRNRAIYSTERVQTVLGWKPEVPFREALARYLEWAKDKGKTDSAAAMVCPTATTASS